MNKITFSKPFVEMVDTILTPHYSKILKRERFFTFLHLVEIQSTRQPDKDLRYDKARLKAAYIKNLIGENYQKYLNVLYSHKIVEVDNTYIVGQKCRDYWITKDFKNDLYEMTKNKQHIYETEDVEISLDLYKKVTKEFLPPTDQTLLVQYNLLKSNNFYFDSIEANKWLENLVETEQIDIKSNRFNVYKRMMINFEDKNIFVKEDETTGRIFTNFNLCKRELRDFCYIIDEDGTKSRLMSVDLKSSQPFLLASLLLQEHPENKNVKEFYRIITEEDIYDYFKTRFIEHNGSNTIFVNRKLISIYTRDDVKIEFLKVLFKNNRGNVALENIFKEDFPDVLEFIRILKRTKSNELAILLQIKESKIFIEVFKNLCQLSIDSLTVHDSLYFKEVDIKIILDVLNSKMEQLGYKNFKFKLS